MLKRATPEATKAWLKAYFGRRPDIGLGKAIVNCVLGPNNPFEPEKRRRPKPGFLFTAGMLVGVFVWFLYFNLTR